jgi:hypothetical protein
VGAAPHHSSNLKKSAFVSAAYYQISLADLAIFWF